eukprot:scaffold6156_cov83-Cylindrotheca_fusiformis.AAC.3
MDWAKSAQSLQPSKRTNKTCHLTCTVKERALPVKERALPKRNRRCLLPPTEGKKEAGLHTEHGLEQLAHPTITLARKYYQTSQVAQHNMYEETYEYIKRQYGYFIVDDPDGNRTTEATQACMEKERAQQKETLAFSRARVADLERELHFARKELEDAYDCCQPKEGEFYRLSQEPDTIVRVFKEVWKDTNKTVVVKYDEETGRVATRGLIGYFVRRNTAVQELEASSEEDCEPPKKKRVMAATCSTAGVPPRTTDKKTRL